jgi:soluble lytic murein transglycosylase-like protein
VCVLLAAPADAQVLEIGPGGAVTTFDGPTLHAGGAARSIREAMGLTDDAPAALTADTAPPVAGALRAPAHVRPLLEAAAARHGLAPALLDAVAHQESRFRQEAVSHKGAIGVMQLMPGTARAMGVDPNDKLQNLDGGARYLRAMLDRFGGDVTLALAAYNAGPGAVERHRGVPPFRETQDYVRRISADLAARAASGAGQTGVRR